MTCQVEIFHGRAPLIIGDGSLRFYDHNGGIHRRVFAAGSSVQAAFLMDSVRQPVIYVTLCFGMKRIIINVKRCHFAHYLVKIGKKEVEEQFVARVVTSNVISRRSIGVRTYRG